jgi:aminoglycoside/choline kinase family phosphotransferase
MIETPTSEPDLVAVADWLNSRNRTGVRLERLEGDVSARRYYRAVGVDGESVIVAFYPPELRDSCRNFTVTARLLDRVGVRSPEILAADCETGFMMLEDLGADTLYSMRKDPWDRLLPWLESGKEILQRIQEIPIETVADLNPALDGALFRRELEQTWNLFLEPRGLVGDRVTAEQLRKALDRLCENLGSAPGTSCHRDFMARNLVPADPPPALVVLDHQDLRKGPPFYDLASLLNDSIFSPPEVERELLADLITTAKDLANYHQAAAQRTLKAIGTFELFSQRGSKRHLHLIPPTLVRALYHLGELPDFSGLLPAIGDSWRSFTFQSSGKDYKEI